MSYVILNDGTRINNCAEYSTAEHIVHTGHTYADAAELLDVINAENAVSVRVFDDEGNERSYSGDMILLAGGSLAEVDGVKTCAVSLRHKTETEIMKDEITELQDAILEG